MYMVQRKYCYYCQIGFYRQTNTGIFKTSFKERLIGSSGDNQLNQQSHKKVMNEKKEQDMTHGVGK